MAKRITLLLLVAAVVAIGAAYASAFMPGDAPDWAPWAMAIGTAAVLAATSALGAIRAGRIGRLAIPLVLVFALVAGGFAAALLLPADTAPDSPLWLGLPRRAAVVLYGIGLVPLLVMPIAYALTFDALTLSVDDLDRIRSAVVAARNAASSTPHAEGEGREHPWERALAFEAVPDGRIASAEARRTEVDE
jgi:hypothetical protein